MSLMPMGLPRSALPHVPRFFMLLIQVYKIIAIIFAMIYIINEHSLALYLMKVDK